MYIGYRSANEVNEPGYTATRDESLGNEVKKRIIVGNFVLSQAAYEDYYIQANVIRNAQLVCLK